MPSGEDRAEPAFQRAAAHVVIELRNAAAVAVGDSVEFGVEFVRQLPSRRFVPGEPACDCMERGTKAGNKNIPCCVVSGCASTRQHQFLDAQGGHELNPLGFARVGGVAKHDASHDLMKALRSHTVQPRAGLTIAPRNSPVDSASEDRISVTVRRRFRFGKHLHRW